MINRRSSRKVALLLSAIMTPALLLGSVLFCVAAEPATATAKTTAIQQLAVMPFITVDSGTRKAKELTMTLDCELRGLCDFNSDILTHPEQQLTEQLAEALHEHYTNALLPQGQVTQDYLQLSKDPDETPRDLAVRFGQQLEADHVMVGLIWHYRQRVGGAWSADSPASVAFSLFMVDVANKKLVWEGQFDKTQQALSDNLFDAALFFTSGIKWLSVEELSEYGIEKTLEKLPRH
ncbi:MAG: hypothetical protein J7K75_09615 [Desulfuromonas sp.]|nr:hypothetical protein [Desulfuromonas sp.]